MRIGDQETPLPTMIMAYSNPRWYDFVSAPYNVPFGEFIEDRIETEVFKDALWAVVGEQQRAGLDLVADSRTFAAGNYSDVVVYYFFRLAGFVPYDPNVTYPLYSTLHSPTCVGDITRAVPMMPPIARMLTELTDAPLKIQWTGAGTLTGLSADRHYSTDRERAMAIAAALNEDILEADAIDQVKVLQIDEWFWPYQYEDWSIEAFNRTVEGVCNAKVMVHLCVGNYRHVVTQLARQPRWILDGAPYYAEDVIYPAADTMVVLDYPKTVVMRRVLRRTLVIELLRRPSGAHRPQGLAALRDREHPIRWAWSSHADRHQEGLALMTKADLADSQIIRFTRPAQSPPRAETARSGRPRHAQLRQPAPGR